MGLSLPREIAACLLYATSDLDDENQLASIEHRQRLTQAWGIPSGSTVLEIGPGQGDLTVVLADVVGPTGRVVAVDNAPLEWGTPDYRSSQAHAKASPVGRQITFVQADPITYLSGGAGDQKFDFIVFGYCIWYFSSPDTLANILQAARERVNGVLIAEYSASASLPAQMPHLLAALTANALESFRGEESKRNIRCALSPRQITQCATAAGWTLAKEQIATPENKQVEGKREVRMIVKPRLFQVDMENVVAQVDAKIGIMLHTMVDAVKSSVDKLQGGVDESRNMDVWIARFEKQPSNT